MGLGSLRASVKLLAVKGLGVAMDVGVRAAKVLQDRGAAEPPAAADFPSRQSPLARFSFDGVAGDPEPVGALLGAQKLLGRSWLWPPINSHVEIFTDECAGVKYIWSGMWTDRV